MNNPQNTCNDSLYCIHNGINRALKTPKIGFTGPRFNWFFVNCHPNSRFHLMFVKVLFVPLENCSLRWRWHYYRCRATNFDLFSALSVIDQKGFSGAPHLLWHRTYIYDGHLRGPMTLSLVAERQTVELSLPVLTTYICRGWDSNTQPPANEANTQTKCAITAELICWNMLIISFKVIYLKGRGRAHEMVL